MECVVCKTVEDVACICGNCDDRIYCSQKCADLDVDHVQCWELCGNKDEALRVLTRRKNNPRLPDLLLHTGLEELERQLDKGRLTMVNGKTLVEIRKNVFLMQPCGSDAKKFLEQAHVLGQGSYGRVYQVDVLGEHVLVIKQTQYDREDTFMWSNMYVEARFFELFSSIFVMPGHCPHLPPFFGFAECVPSGTGGGGGGTETETSSFIISKKAYYGPLLAYLATFKPSTMVLRQFLFEMTFTFAMIQRLYPSFRHNDMKLNNVLADIGPPDGISEYVYTHGSGSNTRFNVPNSGVRSLLWDFDFSSIVGILDNENPTYFGFVSPHMGRNAMGLGPNSGLDLYIFALQIKNWYSLVANSQTDPEYNTFISQWNQTFPTIPTIPSIDPYQQLHTYQFPSPETVIQTSPLFESFRVTGELATTAITTTHTFSFPPSTPSALFYDKLYSTLEYNVPSNTGIPLGFGCGKRGVALLLENIPSARQYARMWPPFTPLKSQPARSAETILAHGNLLFIMETFYKRTIATADTFDKKEEILDDAAFVLRRILVTFEPFYTYRWNDLLAMFAVFHVRPDKISTSFNIDMVLELALGTYTTRDVELAMIQWNWFRKMNIIRD